MPGANTIAPLSSNPTLRQVFRRIIADSGEQVSFVEEEARTTTEWNSRKWWSDTIDDETRERALAREAEAEGKQK